MLRNKLKDHGTEISKQIKVPLPHHLWLNEDGNGPWCHTADESSHLSWGLKQHLSRYKYFKKYNQATARSNDSWNSFM